MPLYTSTYLKSLYERNFTSLQNRIIQERSNIPTEFDIFLSHSYLDKEEVFGLYLELTSFGYVVYVDWIIDPNLDRSNVTKATAELIRNRMKSSKCLLLGISSNVATSKWIPWELGFMDGFTTRCAILPVNRQYYQETHYKGHEFLALYPFIKKHPNRMNIEKLWAIEGPYRYVVFDQWLKINAPMETHDVNLFEL